MNHSSAPDKNPMERNCSDRKPTVKKEVNEFEPAKNILFKLDDFRSSHKTKNVTKTSYLHDYGIFAYKNGRILFFNVLPKKFFRVTQFSLFFFFYRRN